MMISSQKSPPTRYNTSQKSYKYAIKENKNTITALPRLNKMKEDHVFKLSETSRRKLRRRSQNYRARCALDPLRETGRRLSLESMVHQKSHMDVEACLG